MYYAQSNMFKKVSNPSHLVFKMKTRVGFFILEMNLSVLIARYKAVISFNRLQPQNENENEILLFCSRFPVICIFSIKIEPTLV